MSERLTRPLSTCFADPFLVAAFARAERRGRGEEAGPAYAMPPAPGRRTGGAAVAVSSEAPKHVALVSA